jgi:hypothetical protein
MERHTAVAMYMDSNVSVNKDYEKQLDHHFGISKESCGSEGISMSFVKISLTPRALHINQLLIFICKGLDYWCRTKLKRI